MGRRTGYGRVSTGEQDLHLQIDALHEAGCEDVFTDQASGVRGSRPGLDACLATLEPGDILVVWRLDRLGRSMPHLVGLVEDLIGKGDRLPIPPRRRDRHDDGVGRTDVPHLFEPGAVRAAAYPGAHAGGSGRGPSAGSPGRPQVDPSR